MGCKGKVTHKVLTILGMFYICSHCRVNHQIPQQYLHGFGYELYTDSTPRTCECEDISHMIERRG